MDISNINLINLSDSEFYGSQSHTDYPDFEKRPSVTLKHMSNLHTKRRLIISPLSKKELGIIQGMNLKNTLLIQDSMWQNTQRPLNLSNYADLSGVQDKFIDADLIIMINALEYLEDVRPLLSTIRNICISSNKKVLICGSIFTKEKMYGFRQWDNKGIKKLITSCGFVIDEDSSNKNEYSLLISCSKIYYSKFLEANNLPKENFAHLLITTEHSAYRVTGGIGSYINECEQLYGEDSAVLIIDNDRDIDEEKIKRNRWISAQSFLSREMIKQIEFANYDTMADLVFETLKSVLFFYTSVQSIECQEMGLYRTIEAKKIGLINQNIKLITICHGSSFHLAKAKRDVLELENIHVAYREKFTLEESDSVILPTKFLKESYIDSGISGLEDKSRVVKRLPFNHKRLPRGNKLQDYKKLIYIGKTSTIKGFDLFLGTLLTLCSEHPNIKQKVQEVAIYATSTDIREKHLQVLMEEVKINFKVNIYSLNREELLGELAVNSKDSLALVTYTGDNHAMVLLELMGIGHDFIAASAGGSPELIPDDFKNDFLAPPNEIEFSEAVSTAFKNIDLRSNRIDNLREIYKNQQDNINKQYSLESIQNLPVITVNKNKKKDHEKIIVEVIDGGDKQKLEQTIKSLDNQFVLYDLIICSTDAKLSETPPIVYSNYIRLYAGDRLRPRALRYMYDLLVHSYNTSAVVAYEYVPTFEGTSYLGVTYFTPYAPELGSAYLQEKYSRRVIGLFKSSAEIRSSKFTDWERCIAVSGKGETVRTVPKILTALTTVKQGDVPGTLQYDSNMAHAYGALSVFDAYILNYQLKRLDDMYFGSKLFNHLEDVYIKRDDPTVLIGLSSETKKVLAAYDRFVPKKVKNVLLKTSKSSYKAARRIKKSIKRI